MPNWRTFAKSGHTAEEEASNVCATNDSEKCIFLPFSNVAISSHEMLNAKTQAYNGNCHNNIQCGEVVVAQMVEWSLPIPEVRGSNPVIGKNLFIY